MVGVFETPPSSSEFDAGMLWCDGDDFMEMCGHGAIALSMAMVSHGLVHSGEEETTTIRFETPAGPVTSEVGRENGQVAWTRFENVPAFVLAQDVPVALPEVGEVMGDIAFGGNFFAVVKWPFPDTPDRFGERPQASMMMAVFEARGKMKFGQTIRSEGLLGMGRFEGKLLRETPVGNLRAVVPTVKRDCQGRRLCQMAGGRQ
jgi:proline racemase